MKKCCAKVVDATWSEGFLFFVKSALTVLKLNINIMNSDMGHCMSLNLMSIVDCLKSLVHHRELLLRVKYNFVNILKRNL